MQIYWKSAGIAPILILSCVGFVGVLMTVCFIIYFRRQYYNRRSKSFRKSMRKASRASMRMASTKNMSNVLTHSAIPEQLVLQRSSSQMDMLPSNGYSSLRLNDSLSPSMGLSHVSLSQIDVPNMGSMPLRTMSQSGMSKGNLHSFRGINDDGPSSMGIPSTGVSYRQNSFTGKHSMGVPQTNSFAMPGGNVDYNNNNFHAINGNSDFMSSDANYDSNPYSGNPLGPMNEDDGLFRRTESIGRRSSFQCSIPENHLRNSYRKMF